MRLAGDGTLVILLDIDNTLFDSDGLKADFDGFLLANFGDTLRRRFWELYEEVRRELDVVSFPAALERLHQEAPGAQAYPRGVEYLMRYPFKQRLYPGVPRVLRRLRRFGTPVILSDGEPWFQFKKVADSGVARLVDDNVLIFTHKELRLDEVRVRYPASHYAVFDDKPALLAAIKRRMADHVTTVWVRQGHYARNGWGDACPPADIVLDTIAGACRLTAAELFGE